VERADPASGNRGAWNDWSDEYQAEHGAQLGRTPLAWGVWSIPESQLRVLGDVHGKDILELGCGAAQWSIALSGLGARPVGLDLSDRQLMHARDAISATDARVPLVHASGEHVPFADGSFDIVFCDHGATSFARPERTVAEAARLLRPGGRFAFNMSTPLRDACWNEADEAVGTRLAVDYFAFGPTEADGFTEYQLPYGEWIRLLRANGLVVEDLVELRPDADANTTYGHYLTLEWARRWPGENIWVASKPAEPTAVSPRG
jgi:SAM-dependent methyltransferase